MRERKREAQPRRPQESSDLDRNERPWQVFPPLRDDGTPTFGGAFQDQESRVPQRELVIIVLAFVGTVALVVGLLFLATSDLRSEHAQARDHVSAEAVSGDSG